MKSQLMRWSLLVSCLTLSLSAFSAIHEERFDMELKDLETEARVYELEANIRDLYREFLDKEVKKLEEELFYSET